MPFPWSNKVSKVLPAPPPSPEIFVQAEPVQTIVLPVSASEPEPVQTVTLPTLDDKISDIKHKNGECLVNARKEDDETHEVEGDLCQGEGVGTGDQGGEEDLEEA